MTTITRRQYGQYLHMQTRANGTSYISKTDDCPKELEALIYDIHKHFDAMPNDWIYRVIGQAFDDMDQDDYTTEDCSIEADCYNSDLYKWFGEPYALECIDEYASEFADNKDIYTLIAGGQWLALERIYSMVGEFINGEAY